MSQLACWGMLHLELLARLYTESRLHFDRLFSGDSAVLRPRLISAGYFQCVRQWL